MSGETVKRSKKAKRPSGRGFGASEAVAAAAKWRDGYNPLWSLTAERAVWLCQNYSRGVFAELMWLFGAPFMGIESSDPVYGSIIKRRVAALRRMDWSVRVGEAFAGDKRAEEQRAALQAAYDRIENLYEGIAELEMASFRGFAHLEISPTRLTPVAPWNVARDGSRGGWRYNPGAQDCTFESLGAEMDMDPADYVTREVDIPVGRYALVKFLRQSLSDRDWDAFIEIYGLPAWLIVGPPDIPQDKVAAFESAAEKIARGGSGYLPNGSSAQCADSPRGTSPFEARLRYLNEMLVIAGTGGKLTMLAESGSGTLAGNAHQDAFESLAQDDAQDISECFQRQFDAPVLRAAGLLEEGERPKAWFTLDFKEESDTGEVVGQIAQLAAAGYDVDPAQVEELTGYKVTRREPAAQPAPGGFGRPGLFTVRTVKARQDAAPPKGETELAAALQRDLKPIGKVVAEALKTRDWSEAKKRLAGILKECGTESAEALEAAMRKAGEKAWQEEGQRSKVESRRSVEDGETALAKDGECRSKDPEHCPVHGTPKGKDGDFKKEAKNYTPATREVVETFQKELPKDITPEEFDSLLTAGFMDTDGAGNAVKYGTLLRDHIEQNHTGQDRDARKKRLGVAVRMIRGASPKDSKTEGKENERIYMGVVDGKAYFAVADEHNEIGALEMVSYRRDKERDR